MAEHPSAPKLFLKVFAGSLLVLALAATSYIKLSSPASQAGYATKVFVAVREQTRATTARLTGRLAQESGLVVEYQAPSSCENLPLEGSITLLMDSTTKTFRLPCGVDGDDQIVAGSLVEATYQASNCEEGDCTVIALEAGQVAGDMIAQSNGGYSAPTAVTISQPTPTPAPPSEGVAETVQKVAQAISEHPATPAAAVALAAVASTASVASTIPMAANVVASFGSQLPYILGRLWQGLIGLLGVNRRKRPWGRVIRSLTGEALEGVSIRIVDIGNRSGTSAISGPDGSFHSYLPPGHYTLRAFKPGWTIDPSPPALSTLAGEQIYKGEPFDVAEEKMVPIVVAMRETEEVVKGKQVMWRLIWQRTEAFLSRISWLAIILGLTFNTLTMMTGINWLNGLIEVLYVLIIAFKVAVHFRYNISAGTIMNSVTGDPLDLATIRLYDAMTGRMIATRITDKGGSFFTLAPPGVYTLQVIRDGFTPYRESHLVVEGKQSQALALQIRMEPLPETPTT